MPMASCLRGNFALCFANLISGRRRWIHFTFPVKISVVRYKRGKLTTYAHYCRVHTTQSVITIVVENYIGDYFYSSWHFVGPGSVIIVCLGSTEWSYSLIILVSRNLYSQAHLAGPLAHLAGFKVQLAGWSAGLPVSPLGLAGSKCWLSSPQTHVPGRTSSPTGAVTLQQGKGNTDQLMGVLHYSAKVRFFGPFSQYSSWRCFEKWEKMITREQALFWEMNKNDH